MTLESSGSGVVVMIMRVIRSHDVHLEFGEAMQAQGPWVHRRSDVGAVHRLERQRVEIRDKVPENPANSNFRAAIDDADSPSQGRPWHCKLKPEH